MTVEKKVWFYPKNHPMNKPIGVVITKDEKGDFKAWIGIGTGKGADADAVHIAGFGASFPLDAAEVIMRETNR